MRAAVFYGQQDIRITNVPEPRCENGEVLIKVTSVGICGTDA